VLVGVAPLGGGKTETHAPESIKKVNFEQ